MAPRAVAVGVPAFAALPPSPTSWRCVRSGAVRCREPPPRRCRPISFSYASARTPVAGLSSGEASPPPPPPPPPPPRGNDDGSPLPSPPPASGLTPRASGADGPSGPGDGATAKAPPPPSQTPPPRTVRCRRCGQVYEPDANAHGACRFHASAIGAAGAYRLAVTQVRTGVVAGISATGVVREVVDVDEEDEPGGADPWGVGGGRNPQKSSRKTRYRSVLVHRWSCCGAERADEPGCRRGAHLSYDDEDERWSGDWQPRFRMF